MIITKVYSMKTRKIYVSFDVEHKLRRIKRNKNVSLKTLIINKLYEEKYHKDPSIGYSLLSLSDASINTAIHPFFLKKEAVLHVSLEERHFDMIDYIALETKTSPSTILSNILYFILKDAFLDSIKLLEDD